MQIYINFVTLHTETIKKFLKIRFFLDFMSRKSPCTVKTMQFMQDYFEYII